MDIGTVIRIRISKEDKVCILLSKMTWIELDDEWGNWDNNIFIFSQFPEDKRPAVLYSCPQSQAPLYISTDHLDICCELMYGDKRAWITEKDLKFFGKEI